MNMSIRARLPVPDSVPLGISLAVGLVSSLCCGGGLLFGAIGLGAFYGAIGLSRYIPQALAGGAILIALVNWLYYRSKTARMLAGNADCDCAVLRRAMLLSSLLGLIMMSISFVLLEWLNHAVVNAGRFMGHHEHASAVIPGVPNEHLAYLAATFLALPLLAVLPLPHKSDVTNPDQVPSGHSVKPWAFAVSGITPARAIYLAVIGASSAGFYARVAVSDLKSTMFGCPTGASDIGSML